MRSTHSPSLIPKQWQVPQVFRDRLGADPGKQRVMSEEGQYLVILHKVPSAEDRGVRAAALFWINEVGEWKSTPDSGGLSGLIQHLNEYEETAKKLEAQLDSPDTLHSAEYLHEIHDNATPLYRASRHLLTVMEELRGIFSENRKLLLLRDTAVNIERSADLLLADTKSSLEFLIAQNSMKQADAAHVATLEANKLNRLAAFFFPVITLAAILSIQNPEETLKTPSTYGVIICGLILGALLLSILKSKNSGKKSK